MFAGTHHLTIDDKGRLAIPARYRQELADSCASQLFITKGPKPCLEIYPAPVFLALAEQIEAMDDRDEAEILKNWFIGFAVETEIDKQGRILLPPMLRKRTGLKYSALLVGQIRRFDLWPEDEWNARFEMAADGTPVSAPVEAFRKLKR